jgi:hypothetical protein
VALWKRLFGRGTEPKKRVRVCVECGMPVENHKDWCSIFKTRQEMEQRQNPASQPTS